VKTREAFIEPSDEARSRTPASEPPTPMSSSHHARRTSGREEAELRGDVTEREDAPDECTIWPHNASGSALLAEWVTAEEGSFVSLEEMR
jgi:hypothetical protein